MNDLLHSDARLVPLLALEQLRDGLALSAQLILSLIFLPSRVVKGAQKVVTVAAYAFVDEVTKQRRRHIICIAVEATALTGNVTLMTT